MKVEQTQYRTLTEQARAEQEIAIERARQIEVEQQEAEARQRAEQQQRELEKWKADGKVQQEMVAMFDREHLLVNRCTRMAAEIASLEEQRTRAPKDLAATEEVLRGQLAQAEAEFVGVTLLDDAVARVVPLLALREMVRLMPMREAQLKEQLSGIAASIKTKKAQLATMAETLDELQKELRKRWPKLELA